MVELIRITDLKGIEPIECVPFLFGCGYIMGISGRRNLKDFVVDNCTGLVIQDKFVFENDIIGINIMDGQNTIEYSKVVMHNGSWCIGNHEKRPLYDEILDWKIDIFIAGTIHKNSDLLK